MKSTGLLSYFYVKEEGRFIECEATGHDSIEYICIRENCNSCDCNTLAALFQLSMLHHIATTSNIDYAMFQHIG